MNSHVRPASIALSEPVCSDASRPEKIFLVMDKCIKLHMEYMKHARKSAERDSPALAKAASNACDRFRAAAAELTTTRPSSIEDILALLSFVEIFNKGSYAVDQEFRSSSDEWAYSGEDVARFAFGILSNVHKSLKAIVPLPADLPSEKDVPFDMEAPLLEARGLSSALVMAIEGKDRVAIGKRRGEDALLRLAMEVESKVNDVAKMWAAALSTEIAAD